MIAQAQKEPMPEAWDKMLNEETKFVDMLLDGTIKPIELALAIFNQSFTMGIVCSLATAAFFKKSPNKELSN
jgi:hypothetical protein